MTCLLRGPITFVNSAHEMTVELNKSALLMRLIWCKWVCGNTSLRLSDENRKTVKIKTWHAKVPCLCQGCLKLISHRYVNANGGEILSLYPWEQPLALAYRLIAQWVDEQCPSTTFTQFVLPSVAMVDSKLLQHELLSISLLISRS